MMYEVIALTLSVAITITKERVILVKITVNGIPLSTVECIDERSGLQALTIYQKTVSKEHYTVASRCE